MRFDPAAALDYARAMARPRRVGTAANDAVIADLSDRLKTVGCAVEVQPFEFSATGEHAIVVYVLIAQILILIIFWAWGLSAWTAVIPAVLLLALLAGSGQIYRAAARASLWPRDLSQVTRLRRWWLTRGRRYRTANVVARVPTRPVTTARPPILLVAHSDSKSQALPLVARMGLVGLASLAALVFAVLSVLRLWIPWVTSPAALAGLIAILSGVPLLLLLMAGSGNASPGAIDNAAGAGLVLHLAEYLCAHPPSRPVTVLITGAEELGLLGSLAFVQAAGADAQRGATVLNFDGIGTAGRLAMVGGGGGPLDQTVRAACRALQISLGRLPLVGAQFDHLPFADVRIDALSLVSVGRAALSVHTAHDDISKLDIEGFRQAGQVALKVIEALP
jgi:Peptidase family M28